MLLGRSQLLLIGIPTGAALIGLLWLKRRRSKQFHHHTDPGGSIKEILEIKQEIHKVEEINFIERPVVSCIEQEDIIENFEESKISDITENTCKSDLEESKIEDILKKYPLGSEEKILDELKESESITEDPDNPSEETIEILENNLEESKLLNKFTEELIETKILTKEESILENTGNLEESKLEEIKENSLFYESEVPDVKEDQPIASTSITNNKITEKQQLVEEVVHISNTIEKFVENSIDSVKEISEETSVDVQQKKHLDNTSLQKDCNTKENIELEEGAAAVNMKTAPTKQLAEKLASLELDTMKIRDENGDTEQKVCTERDSANHSPSEIMLASPSISNFSDAHSEGSSDSGKGHSDVATSPSRTPAGGSSLAGDLAPSIYEFILPQIIVGRLIGRRGTFLHEIRLSTQTNIYIKRHPDTNKLKICAIEGSQPDIDKALAKIRQKFPIRRFPQLTLEKVSFVTLNPLPPLQLEDFHLQLVEGVNNDVILSSLITAAHFFLQQPSHPSYSSLGTLNHIMNQVYSTSEAPPLETPIKDAVCAAPTVSGWYRAQIINLDEEGGNSTVRFLDYGGYLTLESNNLKQIRGDLLALPFQAVECYLANVKPIDKKGWTEEARLFVHNATFGQVLQAQIYDYAEDGTPLVYLYASVGSQVVLVNEELVMRGYGTLSSAQQEE